MKYKFHYLIFLMVITAYSCKNRGIEVTVEEGTNMSIALSPDESTIALSLQGTIFTIPVAGGDAVSVTDEMGDSQEPSWSPDGEYLTFHSYRDGNYHIWMVSKDGSGLRQLTSGLSDNREPDWSPDGKSIIFSSDRSGNYDIWQINLDNEKLVQLTFDEANDSNPTFSNEGSRIAFVSQRAAGGIYILENNTERLAIPSAMRVAAPSWSKDDTQIAFVSFTGRSMLFDDKNTSYLYTGNPETGELVQVSAGDEDLFPFRVSWTNDHALIYAADGKIKKRATNGINPEIIPFKAVFTLNRESYARKEYDFNNSESRPALGIAGPMVSPDGSKIAFAALGDIYIQEIGGKLIQITDDSYVDLEPDWSPDGNTIAYTSDRGGKMEIWLHNIQTQEAKLLSSQISEDAAMPKWSPDGKQIAFYWKYQSH
jgi:Tol biopolymer transport system component